ncbi:MAG: mechanosensitive ion channel family protein [Alphaproteobacteria bacterium]|nr:MAG: mechanosensitive ion channel family protein [Alphaproteobacteria bacterium]
MFRTTSAASIAEASQNFTQKSYGLFDEVSRWVTHNSVDILVAAAIGVAVALVMLGLRTFGCRLLGRIESEGSWELIFARALAKTRIFFIVMASAELVAEHASTPPGLMSVIHVLFVVAAAFQAAIWGRELILGFVQHRAGMDDEHGRLSSAIGIIRVLVTVALFAIAIILILSNLGVNVTGLVAGLGIGGIAIGLAAQGIFSDLFAALSIIFDKPFRRGDSIRFGEINGNVENIGLKTTRIRSLSGEQIVVSNAKLLDQQIHNFALLDHRRFVVTLGLVYRIAPKVLARVPGMAKEIVEAQEHARFVRCGLTTLGASSLDFELQFDMVTPEWEVAFNGRSAVLLEIVRRFAAEGLEFAYPTQTTFTAAPDGTLIMPYPHVKVLAEKDGEEPEGE